MSCECYQIGGPWITYDPSCPAHGDEAQRQERQREEEQAALVAENERICAELVELNRKMNGPQWVKVADVPPQPGLIVKRFKNGAIWAGRYNGGEKESSFVEYIQLPE